MKLRGKVALASCSIVDKCTFVFIDPDTRLRFPGDVTALFQVDQEVEVTVTAVPAERPAPDVCGAGWATDHDDEGLPCCPSHARKSLVRRLSSLRTRLSATEDARDAYRADAAGLRRSLAESESARGMLLDTFTNTAAALGDARRSLEEARGLLNACVTWQEDNLCHAKCPDDCPYARARAFLATPSPEGRP